MHQLIEMNTALRKNAIRMDMEEPNKTHPYFLQMFENSSSTLCALVKVILPSISISLRNVQFELDLSFKKL